MITASMNGTLLEALIVLLPVSILFFISVVLFAGSKTAGSCLLLVGSIGFVLVVLTHVCEALHLFPSMHWGLEHSPGHYLDFWSAVLGLTLVPFGYLLHLLATRGARA
jgi:hypothetical protein